MEEVTFVSSRPVRKRRAAEDADTRPLERTQHNEDLSSDSESESDGDNDPDAVMSEVRISTKPQGAHQHANVNTTLKRENYAHIPLQIAEDKKRKKSERRLRKLTLLRTYIEELQKTLMQCTGHNGAGQEHIGMLSSEGMQSITTVSAKKQICELEEIIKRRIREGHAALRTLSPGYGVRQQPNMSIATLNQCIVTLRHLPVMRRSWRLAEVQPRATGVDSDNQHLINLQEELGSLKAEVGRQQKLRIEESRNYTISEEMNRRARAQESRKQEKLLEQQTKVIEKLEEAQVKMQSELQQRGAEISALKEKRSNRETRTNNPAVKREGKEKKKTKGTLLVAAARLAKMYEHYDRLHTKNTVMLGKLTAMAQAGGFGNPGSLYRKELDGLKGPSLHELGEQEEGE